MPQVQHLGWHRVPDVVIMEIDCSCNGLIRVEVAGDGGNAGLMVRGLQTCDREDGVQLVLYFVTIHMLSSPLQRVLQLRTLPPQIH
jgi:hypothetical protein